MLELNTATATMREVLDKVVKRKLGVTDPVIMQGSNLLHESGEDIEEDMVAYYTALLDKVRNQTFLLPHRLIREHCRHLLRVSQLHVALAYSCNWRVMSLEQKFVDYPTSITTGVVLTVEDYHQDFRCSLHVKHRYIIVLLVKWSTRM